MVAIKIGQELKVANIGDSGFLLIRFSENGEPYVVQKSKEQQHSFNIPY
jgi:serine/threonine protein phosphatase PrpC